MCTENDRKDTFASRVRVIPTGFLVVDKLENVKFLIFSYFCVLDNQSHFVEKISGFVRVVSSLCDIISLI